MHYSHAVLTCTIRATGSLPLDHDLAPLISFLPQIFFHLIHFFISRGVDEYPDCFAHARGSREAST